jgi:hypothetical protein
MRHILCICLFIFFASFLNAQTPEWLWAKSAGGNDADIGNAVASDIRGNVFVTGSYRSSDITFGSYTLPNVYDYDIFLTKYGPAGNVLWAKGSGGNDRDEGVSVAVDEDGSVYVCGNFKSDSIDFDGLTLHNFAGHKFEIFLVKFDSAGIVQWAKSFGSFDNDVSQDLAVDTAGNLYMTGSFGGLSITFDTIVLNNVSTSPSADIFFAKFDPYGNALWANGIGGNNVDCGYSIAIDKDNELYLATLSNSNPITYGSTTFAFGVTPQFVLCKFDPAGDLYWIQHFIGTGACEMPEVSVNSSKDIFVSGSIKNGISFGSVILTPTAGTFTDVFIAKLDSLGTGIWGRCTGGNRVDHCDAVAADEEGNVYIGGMIGSASVMFDTIPLSFFGPNAVYFLVKYDNSGNALWLKSDGGIGNDRIMDISVNDNGMVYISGGFATDTIHFDTIAMYNPGGYLYSNTCVAALGNGYVWPGDTDNNNTVSNDDLLPIGLYFGSIGFARDSIGNTWQADTSVNWPGHQYNGINLKHVDCNGDSIVNADDTLAVNLNYNLAHAFSSSQPTVRVATKPIYFIAPLGPYSGGDWVNLELWVGTASETFDDFYGVAFNIQYPSFLVQSGTEQLDYSSTWLENIDSNALSLQKTNVSSSTIHGAIVRTDHIGASGYGKVADLKFQLKPSVTATDAISLNVFYTHAVKSDGVTIPLDAIPLTLNSTVGIAEIIAGSTIRVFPNPSDGLYSFNGILADCKLEIIDITGRIVYSASSLVDLGSIDLRRNPSGIYFYRIISPEKATLQGKLIHY